VLWSFMSSMVFDSNDVTPVLSDVTAVVIDAERRRATTATHKATKALYC
jgi:hypothetical protein